MNNRIFFLIDFQNDFITPDGLLTINNPALIKRVQDFADNLPVTWEYTLESKDFPLHCEYGTKGWELAISIKDSLPVKILYKPTVNVWAETSQYACLNQDFADKDVYLAGLVTEICVKNALDGLLAKGAKSVTLFDDLTGGLKLSARELCNGEEYKQYIENKQLFVIKSQEL